MSIAPDLGALAERNARETFASAAEILRLPEPLSIREWSEKYRFVAKGTSPLSRDCDRRFEALPYQREPLDSFTDPDVQVCVLDWASRLGKTELLNCVDGYCIHHAPRGTLVVYPTIDSAKAWRREFFDPMVEATPVLRDIVAPPKSRKGGNTLLHVKFPGGFIRGIGTNSPSAFRQIQAPTVRCDEIDAMLDGREGDPILLAFRRADNYPDSIQILSSTPTIKGFSRIENWLERSDYRKWNVPCPKCNKLQILLWPQIVWPKNQPEKAELVCLHCDSGLNDRHRVDMIRAGHWRATQDFNGVREYWLNGINSLFPSKKGFRSKLHQMAQEFLDAKRGKGFEGNAKQAIKVWVNTFKAETYEEEGAEIAADPLLQRREPYTIDSQNPGKTPLPAGVLLLTAGVDVQDDRLEAEIVGWGEGEESWGIEFAVFEGDPNTPDRPGSPSVWTLLDNWLMREFRTENGHALHVAATCVDTGGHRTEAAYRFVRPRQVRRVFGVKGASTHASPIVNRPAKSKTKKVRLIIVGTDTAKELLFSRLQLSEPGPGYMHYPQSYSEVFFKQLTNEKAVTVVYKGQPILTFVPKGPHEALDIRVYSLAAFKLLNANLPAIAKKLSVPMETPKDPESNEAAGSAEKPAKPEAPAPVKSKIRRSRPLRRGGWV